MTYNKIAYILISVGALLVIPYVVGDIGRPIIAGSAVVGILFIFSGGVFLSQRKTSPVYKTFKPLVVGYAIAVAILILPFLYFYITSI